MSDSDSSSLKIHSQLLQPKTLNLYGRIIVSVRFITARRTGMFSNLLELDRDWNASINVLERGLEFLGERLGLGQSEVERLKETRTSVESGSISEPVSASTVVQNRKPKYE